MFGESCAGLLRFCILYQLLAIIILSFINKKKICLIILIIGTLEFSPFFSSVDLKLSYIFSSLAFLG